MVRTVIVPENKQVHIELPDSCIGTAVEIIAFQISEDEKSSSEKDVTGKDDILEFYEMFNLDVSLLKVSRDEANER